MRRRFWIFIPLTLSLVCDAHAESLAPEVATRLAAVHEAIVAREGVRAARAWPDAWHAAQVSRRWEPLLTAGDAALRIGELTGARLPARVNARQAYRAALYRAYSQGSVDGVLRAAEAMILMGDREVPETALHMARKLAASSGNQEVRDRVERDALRIAACVTGTPASPSADRVP
ncbi:MAG: hypothetical protein ACREM3_01265 [Candidatus Rokuibacteriota bacterium]